jgi:hypothetical protein
MRNSAPSFTKSDPRISTSDLARYAEGWLLAGDIDQHSERTLGSRRGILNKLLWFPHYKEFVDCGLHELRHFLAYRTHGHKDPAVGGAILT